MKNWKISAISYGLFVVVATLLNMVFMNQPFSKAIVSSIISVVFFALIFEFFFIKMMGRLVRKYTPAVLKTIPDVELEKDERFIKVTGANHFKGIEGVGGKLTLTNKRLVFLSHKFNIQNHKEEFSVDDIVMASAGEADKPNREKVFTIKLRNNEHHRFVVDSPLEWVNLLPH